MQHGCKYFLGHYPGTPVSITVYDSINRILSTRVYHLLKWCGSGSLMSLSKFLNKYWSFYILIGRIKYLSDFLQLFPTAIIQFKGKRWIGKLTSIIASSKKQPVYDRESIKDPMVLEFLGLKPDSSY